MSAYTRPWWDLRAAWIVWWRIWECWMPMPWWKQPKRIYWNTRHWWRMGHGRHLES